VNCEKVVKLLCNCLDDSSHDSAMVCTLQYFCTMCDMYRERFIYMSYSDAMFTTMIVPWFVHFSISIPCVICIEVLYISYSDAMFTTNQYDTDTSPLQISSLTFYCVPSVLLCVPVCVVYMPAV